MKKLFLFFVTAALLSSCASDNADSQADKYDRSAMLQNWADNSITPAFNDYNTRLAMLKTAEAAFTTAPNEAALTDLRNKWLDAYKVYQHVALFTIGKAEEIKFTKFSNTFPTSIVLINNKIATADFNLEGPGNDVAQGFPALDYLLFGLADNPAAIVEFYTVNAKAANYKNYLTAVVDKMVSLFTTVYTDWNGGYKATFVSKTENSVSGSVNKMVNAFVYFYEKEVRTGKVGIPAGRFSTTPLPEKVEGYYSRIYSKELLAEGLTACHNFFKGKHYSTGAAGASLKSYLEFLGSKANDGTQLSVLMDNQFIAAANAIGQMMPSLHDQVVTDNTKMLASFDALQRNVAYMKIDMVSAMNITIDYVDSDGD